MYGTRDIGLLLEIDSDDAKLVMRSGSKTDHKQLKIAASSDSDHAGDPITRFTRYAGGVWCCSSLVDWFSKTCNVINLSSCESEIFAGNFAGVRGAFLSRVATELNSRRVLEGNDQDLVPPFDLYLDNGAAVRIIQKCDYFSVVLRAADIRVKWVLVESSRGRIRAWKIKGEFNAVDLMTKVLGRVRHGFLCNLIGMRRPLLTEPTQEGNAEITWGLFAPDISMDSVPVNKSELEEEFTGIDEQDVN